MMKHDPIVALVSTYKEGRMVQGAISSLKRAGIDRVIVVEGPWGDYDIEGEPTNLGPFKKYWQLSGRWRAEAEKRNLMHQIARKIYGNNFWQLLLDADEILIWGEYLHDHLNVLRPGYPDSQENIFPMRVTVVDGVDVGGMTTYLAPNKLMHSSMIGEYRLGCLEIVTPDNKLVVAGTMDIDPTTEKKVRNPVPGEPHIFHRHWLRRFERATLRGSDTEEKELAERARKAVGITEENSPSK